ncbi:MAG: quinol:electron acceptor oxidoreductase subunit ActD, partial [Verrucomicrobiota bacterium]
MSTVLKRVQGYLAEFGSVKELYHAAEKARDEGFKRWDVHSPFPIHGMDAA